MKKESKNKNLIIVLILMITMLGFVSTFVDWAYADPDTENPIVPIEPENPTPQPQPQPQPTPQTQQPVTQPQVNQNTQNNNHPAEEESDVQKTDTRLESLSIECGDLNPEFSSDIYSYTVYVKRNADNKSCITYAKALEPDITEIKVKGPKEFSTKNTKKTVTIEAEDGSKSEYVINIHILKDDEIFVGGVLLKTVNPEKLAGLAELFGSRFGTKPLLLKVALYAITILAAVALTKIIFKSTKNRKKTKSFEVVENREIMLSYATTVVLNYINSVNVKKNFRPPSYFSDELKIGDVKSFIRKLEKREYLELSSDYIYRLTSKGKNFLDDHLDYIEFFNIAANGISITEYYYASENETEDSSFEKIMIKLIVKKLKHLNIEDDFKIAGNLHYIAGKLYHNLSLQEQALFHYLSTLYLCVSGVKNRKIVSEYSTRRHSNEYMLDSYSDIYISPYLVSDIEELGNVYEEELADLVYEKNMLSFNLCSLKMYKSMVQEIIAGEFILEKWQGTLRTTFETMLKDSLSSK